MSETENLILAVEKYPCLWDIRNEDYHNRDMKELAWQQVCLEMYRDWECQSNELKKKWTHIRDYYRKDLQKIKNTPTGSAAKKQKRYVFADMLHFLTPVFNSRRSEIRKMNDNQKIEFKIGMLQLVKKIHESRYISPGPSSLETNYSPMSAPSPASNLSSLRNSDFVFRIRKPNSENECVRPAGMTGEAKSSQSGASYELMNDLTILQIGNTSVQNIIRVPGVTGSDATDNN
ncbi:hypothetical protein NQ315_015234 [Exocentrus adspersus]|uniref:MADF domain-containing protein n=1 Tax=Exocentrus adspersus TaxID=1586481 RepID=A0AAV8VBU3_9CUCU|nr:hypothetical protein NQ315_015234 [Exocentrus adspersus]